MTTVPDTSEGFTVSYGWQDPAEPTGSDDETQPVKYVPIRDRIRRPRIHKYSDGWMFSAPFEDKRFEIDLRDGTTIRVASKQHDTFAEALATFRAESIKDLGFVPDAKVQIIANAFPSMDNERGVDYRGATGRVVKVDLDMKLPIAVELDHYGYSQMFDVAELEVLP
ncbi:MAG: hypothetical protein ACTHJ9_13830 [Rhodanobacter sp.]